MDNYQFNGAGHRESKKRNVNANNINYNSSIVNGENKFEHELGDRSTKAEFSDFEDELNYKLCGNYNNNQDIDEYELPEINKLNIPSIDKVTQSHSNYERKKTPNFSIISPNSSISKKQKNNEQTIFNQLPFLSSFKPKYAKRETIDKKIIRHFRQFFITQVNEKKIVIDSTNKDYSFYILFKNGNLPPIDLYDVNVKERIAFKSFNSNYLLWFFGKQGVKEIYLKFVSIQGAAFVEEVGNYYGISEAEKNQLSNYVNNLPFIFDISLVNKITDDEGYNCGHIYRKLKGKKGKKVWNKKEGKLKKERSREHDPSFQHKKSSSEEDYY